MTDGNFSAADILAMSKNNDNDAWTNNPFIYLVWMFVMRWFNGNGVDGSGALTRAELYDGLNGQDILGNQRSIMDSLCGISSNMSAGFGDIRYDNLSNVMNLSNSITNGFNSVNSGLAENRFAQQSCCCATQKAIADLSAENYRNTCEITNAIHGEGELTRSLINQNTMQDLRDKLADKDRELLFSNFQISQTAQTGALVDALRPVSKPAYITCSPYQSATNGTCGCGYGL